MKQGRILIFLILSAMFGSPIFGKVLSKNEIKKIIQAASYNKGRYKIKAKITKPKHCITTKGYKTTKKQQVAKAMPKNIKRITKKPEPILPFEITPSVSEGGVKIGQKGFVLIKGEPERKIKNPLLKL